MPHKPSSSLLGYKIKNEMTITPKKIKNIAPHYIKKQKDNNTASFIKIQGGSCPPNRMVIYDIQLVNTNLFEILRT